MPHKRTSPAREIIDYPTLLRICVAAEASPRTVDRVLLGLPVRGRVAQRILKVLLSCGIVPQAPTAEPAPKNGGAS